MNDRQGGEAALIVHQDHTNWEAPFIVHSVNAQVTSCFVRFLNKTMWIACIYRASTAGIHKDAELLVLKQTILARTKKFVILGDPNIPDIN